METDDRAICQMKPLQQKTFTTPIIVTLFLGLALAQLPVRSTLADELKNISNFKECEAIKGKSERLLCYDTIAKGGIFNEEKLQQVQVENFGSKEKEAEISIDELGVTVVRIQKDVNGLHYFQTSEGQVWKQANRGNWSSEVPFEANIKAGALGSFFLVNEGGKSTRVKRVR